MIVSKYVEEVREKVKRSKGDMMLLTAKRIQRMLSINDPYLSREILTYIEENGLGDEFKIVVKKGNIRKISVFKVGKGKYVV